MRSHRQALIALLAFAVLPPSSVHPAEWSEEIPEGVTGFYLEELSFEGDFTLSEGELRDVVKTKLGGLPPLSWIRGSRHLDLDQIDGDVVRLRNHFRRRGYWNVKVTGRRLIQKTDDWKAPVRVVFRIEQGAQRLTGAIGVVGMRSYSPEEILSWTDLRTGDPFDIGQVDRDRKKIEGTYANQGFYQVRVVADIQPADSGGEGPVVHDLIYRVEEGQRYHVGLIRIEGNEFTRSEILRRELTVETGDFMSRDGVAESRARLYATGYFSSVELLPENVSEERGTVDLSVRVVERKMRFVAAGVGYGSRDQLRVSADWGHRNLWGTGRRGAVRGILATELFPTDLVRARVEGRYVQPWLFNTRTQLTMELFYERSREFFEIKETRRQAEYDLNQVVLGMNVIRRLTRFTRVWVSPEIEWADLDQDPGAPPAPDDSKPDVTRSVSLTLERDRRDDYFNPRKGFLNRIVGRYAGGFLGGDNDFWKAFVEANWFRRFGVVTLAGRLRVGYEQPFAGSPTVPDRERFKLGGATTVRGYDEQQMSTGDFMILSNFEARFPIFWILGAGFFVDGGNAWEDVSDVRLEDFSLSEKGSDPGPEFRYSIGAGLRVATPVGPVRVDWARKLKILPGEGERAKVHLSLGHVF